MAEPLAVTMMTEIAMHSDRATEDKVERPDIFNFALDVVDYWASQDEHLKAMHWVSQDHSTIEILTFGHFSRRSQQIAMLFERLGINEGETLIMMLPRLPAWWEIALAAIRSGVVFSPVPMLCTQADIRYRCNQTRATVFVGDTLSIGKFLEVRSDCASVRTIIQVEGPLQESAISLRSALDSIDPNGTVQPVRRSWDTPALTYFTSGTSGPPKMVRHNQVSAPLAHRTAGKFWYQLRPGKMLWNTGDQGWAKAAYSFFGAWSCGATLFVHDDRGAFDKKRLIDTLHKYPITTICAPPLAYRQLVLEDARAYMKQHPPKALSHCTTAGEALNADVSQKWLATTGLHIYEGYGQTETVLLCGNFPGVEVRPGSMGKAVPNVPVHVLTADGAEASPGAEGEIAVLLGDASDRTGFFGLFDGYVNGDGSYTRREKTFNIGGRQQRWYLTGDRATRDSDGYFWFVGRADDVINSSGYRIGPFEVESTLKLHPAVAECAVTSSPDATRGEVVKAFVVLTASHTASNELRSELQAFCKKNAAPYKYPRKIDFVSLDDLPKTTSGKIQRSLLRKQEWSRGTRPKL